MRKLVYVNPVTGQETASFAEMKEWNVKANTVLRDTEAPVGAEYAKKKKEWDELNAPSEAHRKARNKALGF